MSTIRLITVLITSFVVLTGCTDHDPTTSPCDAVSLADTLENASPGETVSLGECTLAGSFTIPEGVTLAGAGDTTVLNTDSDVVLRLAAGPAGSTGVRDVRVNASGRVGIVATGDGEVVFDGVTVTAERGYALGVEGATRVRATDVDLVGPVDASNYEAPELVTASSDTSATYGLVFLDVDVAELSAVQVRGFAQFGAVILDSTSEGASTGGTDLTWSGGGVSDTLGTGLYVSGGTASLDTLELGRTWRGLRGVPSYAAIFTGGVTCTTMQIAVTDNDNFGILQEGGSCAHVDASVTGNGKGGIVVGEAEGFSFSGAASMMQDNGSLNIFLLNSHDVDIRDATIGTARMAGSELHNRPIGGEIMLGDGIHLIGTHTNVNLENLVLHDNERAQLVIDLGSGGGSVAFNGVTVRGTGMQLGAVGGMTDDPSMPNEMSPVAPDGVWDAGISREGDTSMNDLAAVDAMDIAGIVTPVMLPRPSEAAGIVTPVM